MKEKKSQAGYNGKRQYTRSSLHLNSFPKKNAVVQIVSVIFAAALMTGRNIHHFLNNYPEDASLQKK